MMDIQTMLNNAVKAQRNEELKNSPQLLLGEMILKLEAVKDQSKPLFIDLMDKRPTDIGSWRGSYCELSIGTEGGDKENPTVRDWIKRLKQTIGKTFTGYKGGDFLMGKNTPVWLAEYGESSFKIDDKPLDKKDYSNYKSVFFIDVREDEGKVYLITKIEEE
jgi:hypothetical protein